jgi:phage-related protein
METFPWEASMGTSKETKARVIKTQYGDGYSQRLGDGINSIDQSWQVTVKAKSLSEADDIEAFLSSHSGAAPFLWPTRSVPSGIKVTCDAWRRQDRFSSGIISATFLQVFDP